MKKGQMQQIFIFIIAILIASMIFLYGYRAIRDFTQRTDEVTLVKFQTELQSAVRTISSDYGSVKRLELSIPSKYSKVCFVDYAKFNQGSAICTRISGREDEFNPLICDAWKDQTQNVFLVPFADIPIKTNNLEVSGSEGFMCRTAQNGRIAVRLEGRGDRALIDEWQWTIQY